MDSLFTYVFVNYLTKSGIASLVRIKKIHLSLILFIEALLLYGFQYVKEKVTNKRVSLCSWSLLIRLLIDGHHVDIQGEMIQSA